MRGLGTSAYLCQFCSLLSSVHWLVLLLSYLNKQTYKHIKQTNLFIKTIFCQYLSSSVTQPMKTLPFMDFFDALFKWSDSNSKYKKKKEKNNKTIYDQNILSFHIFNSIIADMGWTWNSKMCAWSTKCNKNHTLMKDNYKKDLSKFDKNN